MEKRYRKELGKHSPKHPHFQMGRARRSSALAICVMWHLGHPGFAFRIFPSFSSCTYSFRESGFSHGSHHPGLRLRGCVHLAPGSPADGCSPSLPAAGTPSLPFPSHCWCHSRARSPAAAGAGTTCLQSSRRLEIHNMMYSNSCGCSVQGNLNFLKVGQKKYRRTVQIHIER